MQQDSYTWAFTLSQGSSINRGNGSCDVYREREFYIDYSGERSSNNGGDSGKNVIFPTLKKLSLLKLPNLVEWKDAMELTTIEMMFPCLVELRIEICGQLTSAPCHFLSLKKLDVTNIKCMAFERIISKLSTLASLKIFNISQLVCLQE